jgi:hypothetical protein
VAVCLWGLSTSRFGGREALLKSKFRRASGASAARLRGRFGGVEEGITSTAALSDQGLYQLPTYVEKTQFLESMEWLCIGFAVNCFVMLLFMGIR